jgi:sterol desaturase/sphingolipid hydroxylase (fatty acid hydroxylase superfamily)
MIELFGKSLRSCFQMILAEVSGMEAIIGQFFGLFLFFLIFTPLERFFALRKEQRIFRPSWLTDATHFLCNRFLVDGGSIVAIVALVIFWRWMINSAFQAGVAAQPFWLQFIEALFLIEFLGYTYHRWCHSSPLLWKFHAVHHSSSQMDWLAAARSHPLDQIFSRVFFFVPFYILGFNEKTLGVFLFILVFNGIYLHSNIRFRFKYLRWLIVTPEHHHWHHSNDPEARNKNFAALFPLMDWIFGSLYLPKGKMPMTYGISEEMPGGFFAQMKYPFRKLRGESE